MKKDFFINGIIFTDFALPMILSHDRTGKVCKNYLVNRSIRKLLSAMYALDIPPTFVLVDTKFLIPIDGHNLNSSKQQRYQEIIFATEILK